MAARSYTILLEQALTLDRWLEDLISKALEEEQEEIREDAIEQFDLTFAEQEEVATDYTVEGDRLVIRLLVPTELKEQVMASQDRPARMDAEGDANATA